MSKRFGTTPGDLLGLRDDYERWCVDEACMYLLCRIEQDGRLPKALSREGCGADNARTVSLLSARRGVRSVDLRTRSAESRDAPAATVGAPLSRR